MGADVVSGGLAEFGVEREGVLVVLLGGGGVGESGVGAGEAGVGAGLLVAGADGGGGAEGGGVPGEASVGRPAAWAASPSPLQAQACRFRSPA
jgi:hypothetical protein